MFMVSCSLAIFCPCTNRILLTFFYRSFLKEFDKKPWTVNEQIKIIHDFLDVGSRVKI